MVSATIVTLTAVGRESTPMGLHAIELARRLAQPKFDTGQAVASLSKEWRAVMSEALRNAEVAADPVDELKRRRAAKRARATGKRI